MWKVILIEDHSLELERFHSKEFQYSFLLNAFPSPTSTLIVAKVKMIRSSLKCRAANDWQQRLKSLSRMRAVWELAFGEEPGQIFTTCDVSLCHFCVMYTRAGICSTIIIAHQTPPDITRFCMGKVSKTCIRRVPMMGSCFTAEWMETVFIACTGFQSTFYFQKDTVKSQLQAPPKWKLLVNLNFCRSQENFALSKALSMHFWTDLRTAELFRNRALQLFCYKNLKHMDGQPTLSVIKSSKKFRTFGLSKLCWSYGWHLTVPWNSTTRTRW